MPNAAARGLRMQKTETIGLLLYPTCARLFRNIFTGEVIEGVEQALIDAGYHLLSHRSPWSGSRWRGNGARTHR